MARKRKVAPNPEMLRLLEKRKQQEAEFDRDMKALEAKRKARLGEVALLVEECGALEWSNADLRALILSGVEQKKSLQKAA